VYVWSIHTSCSALCGIYTRVVARVEYTHELYKYTHECVCVECGVYTRVCMCGVYTRVVARCEYTHCFACVYSYVWSIHTRCSAKQLTQSMYCRVHCGMCCSGCCRIHMYLYTVTVSTVDTAYLHT